VLDDAEGTWLRRLQDRWVLGAIGALLGGASAVDRRTGTVDPEVDEDGYLVKPGSTDLHT
jgi:hypothetical protein